jgi:hypothetical protein
MGVQRMQSERSASLDLAHAAIDGRRSLGFRHSILINTLLPILFVQASTSIGAPQPDDSKPPVAVGANGGFSARRLTSAPAIDGEHWIATDVVSRAGALTTQATNSAFSLLLKEPDEDTGDVLRYELYLQHDQHAPVRIDNDFTAWVYVTPDNRYVFTEPLYALDVREWKQYRLFDVLEIQNYTSIDAISHDGRHLLVSRRDCPFDCGDQRPEYYELTLPR